MPDTITHHCVDACLNYSNLWLLPKNTEDKLSEEISNYDTVGDNIGLEGKTWSLGWVLIQHD